MNGVYRCQHCDFVAHSIEERNEHYSTHKVVKDRDEDGKLRRTVV